MDLIAAAADASVCTYTSSAPALNAPEDAMYLRDEHMTYIRLNYEKKQKEQGTIMSIDKKARTYGAPEYTTDPPIIKIVPPLPFLHDRAE